MSVVTGSPHAQWAETASGSGRRLPEGPGLGRRERLVLGVALVAIVAWGSIGVDYEARFERPTVAAAEGRRTQVIVGATFADPTVERGRAVFEANGCGACHSIDGTERIGPSLAGIWGTAQVLRDGSTAVVDAVYVQESVLAPQAREVRGYDAQMPSYDGLVTEEDLAALVAYVKSLG